MEGQCGTGCGPDALGSLNGTVVASLCRTQLAGRWIRGHLVVELISMALRRTTGLGGTGRTI